MLNREPRAGTEFHLSVGTLSTKIFSIAIIILCFSCYFKTEDFTWQEEECCKWSRSIVFYSNQTGYGDIYTIFPDGTNSFPLTLNLLYNGKGTYTCGDIYTDTNGNGHYDPWEDFTDLNSNLCWDTNEEFIDSNSNGIWDSSLAEPFQDENNNGLYDCGEEYEDLNDNGHYDPQEEFTDTNGNGCHDDGEPYFDSNGNNKWDSSLAEPFWEFTKIIKKYSSENMPSCSSDATSLLFTSDINGYDEIYLMNLGSKNIKQLTNDRDGHTYPSFSPDNSKIAYVKTVHDPTPPYTGRNQIFIMNADGSDKIQLTNDDSGVTAPAWSSDGTKIAYIKAPDSEGSIYIINSDGSGEPVKVSGVFGAKGPLSWLNNDTEVLYWAYSENGAGIYRAPIDGSFPPYTITSPFSDNFNPNLSHDKNSIVYVSNQDGYYEIYISDLDGQFQRRVTNSGGIYYVNNPAWCP
jgi:TolB protein